MQGPKEFSQEDMQGMTWNQEMAMFLKENTELCRCYWEVKADGNDLGQVDLGKEMETEALLK